MELLLSLNSLCRAVVSGKNFLTLSHRGNNFSCLSKGTLFSLTSLPIPFALALSRIFDFAPKDKKEPCALAKYSARGSNFSPTRLLRVPSICLFCFDPHTHYLIDIFRMPYPIFLQCCVYRNSKNCLTHPSILTFICPSARAAEVSNSSWLPWGWEIAN